MHSGPIGVGSDLQDIQSSMKTRSRICVIGSANVDLTFRTPRFPLAGETIKGHALHQGLGGKGANQAVAAARLGADVSLVACVGDDAFGVEAIRQYQADGIDTLHIRNIAGQPTGTAAIIVDDKAENSIIVIPGANALLSSADVQLASSSIAQADAVLCQLETPLAATLESFRIARAAGKLTVLTPAPATELPDAMLALCDVCVLNRHEMELLVGRPVHTLEDAHVAAQLLRNRGVKSIAMTMGSDGAFIVDESVARHVPAMQVEAIDTTGAGDAFAAALSVFLCEGCSLHEAALQATVVSAITVTRLGTHASFPQRSEVEKRMHLTL